MIFFKFLKILKNERNITNFGYVFVSRFNIRNKNFSDDWTNSCTVIASIFFQKRYFHKRQKSLKTIIWILKNQHTHLK